MTRTREVLQPNQDRNYFYMTPNIVDLMGLDVYSYRLYGKLKRISGENGGPVTLSRAKLSKDCSMSTGQVTNAKNNLIKRGLIEIEEVTGDRGRPYHKIYITDIWQQNVAFFKALSQADDEYKSHLMTFITSCDDLIRSCDDFIRSCGEPYLRTVLKNQYKEPVINDHPPADNLMTHPGVVIYRDITKITPNMVQRQKIVDHITTEYDQRIFSEVVEHWLGHGFNKMNVVGMIELVIKGGVKACRTCAGGVKPKPKEKSFDQRQDERENYAKWND